MWSIPRGMVLSHGGRFDMAGSTMMRRLGGALGASLALHVVAVGALAWVTLPALVKNVLHVQHTPFAGQQVAIALSIARPESQLPPLPERPPVESPVLITPDVAQIEHHVYVDRQSADAPASTPLAAVVEVAEVTVPDLPVAEREATPSAKPNGTPARQATALARTPRTMTPSTAAVTVPPQTLGTSERRPARLFNNRPPRYPDIARQNRWQGTVLLKLAIDAAGRVTDVQVERSSGYALLDAEAAAAVRIWRGEPALRDGVPVASVEYLPVRFRLP